MSGSRPFPFTIDGDMGLSEDDAIRTSKRMYYFGFFLLPWMWFVNVWYFWPVLRSEHLVNHPIRLYARRSLIGFVIFTLCLLPWSLIYLIGGNKVLSQRMYDKLNVDWVDESVFSDLF
eukprot:jgi/Mesvir1/16362/Mv18110-RA.1